MIIGGFSNYDLVNCLKIVKGDQGDKMFFFKGDLFCSDCRTRAALQKEP